ncbi:predicted protein [Thalassiosira pseudonana CCMP1335]|uniref:Glycosyltransferase 2-like domain-containing protein n=1 Tax=Thalassiosira pseudonana TaxID=35128 RepID=B8BZX5_THAPS|nr:predicted protein [Thalassiosira pseudonana CCMP1335]EED92963.1 predicted protein [Thalassiosira pseudonana CCMP1335]
MSAAQDSSDLIGLISSFLGPTSRSDVSRSSGASTSTSTPSSRPSFSVSSTTNRNVIREASPARVVVFSKDRPWQLQELLLSMKLASPHYNNSTINRIDIYIILHATSPLFRDGYERVILSIKRDQLVHERNHLHFLFEGEWVHPSDTAPFANDSNSFSQILQYVLVHDISNSNAAVDSEGITIFLTDDCLLLEPLETILVCAAGALSCSRDGQQVFNFVSRLHPGIAWSQTRNVASPPPREEMRYRPLQPNLGVYVYRHQYGKVEWRYPFDLSGGVYWHKDVLHILNNISALGRNEILSHPNTFEIECNKMLMIESNTNEVDLGVLITRKALSAIPTHPFLVITTINRVQDVCQAPLASGLIDNKTDRFDVDPSDPVSLLQLLDGKSRLDIERYKTKLYNASHVGDFFLCDSTPINECDSTVVIMGKEPINQEVKLSVLIPVHKGPTDVASHSIISVMMQLIDELDSEDEARHLLLSPMQIVIVDDRCDDGSIDAMTRSAKRLVSSRNDISLYVIDHRCQPRDALNDNDLHDSKGIATRGTIMIDLVSSPRAGVASALNFGIKHCKCEIIARMDADDVSAPKRLITQLQFMNANPQIHVVGTSTVLFSTMGGGVGCNIYEENCCILRNSLSITDPGFMAWALLFTCSVSHPSVMMRKKTIEAINGYDESFSSCEDYDLWVRLTQKDCRALATIPFLGLWHRKHTNSSTNKMSQKEESGEVSCAAIRHLIHDNSIGFTCDVSALRNPANATTASQLDDASRLLQLLESAFLQKHAHQLTQEERCLIRQDCNARAAELASVSMSKFGSRSLAWELWCERCPEQHLERLSLLCHLKATEGGT